MKTKEERKILKEKQKVLKKASKLVLSAGPCWVDEYHSSKVDAGMSFVSIRKGFCYLDEDYAQQVLNIDQLYKNRKKLEEVDASTRVSYYTQLEARNFADLVDEALEIYKKGLDTPDFDKDVETLNKFLKSHLVFRVKYGGPRTTFRLFSRKDLKHKEYDANGKRKSPNNIKEERRAYYQAMATRFSGIIKSDTAEKTF